jgi:hypothetical protein
MTPVLRTWEPAWCWRGFTQVACAAAIAATAAAVRMCKDMCCAFPKSWSSSGRPAHPQRKRVGTSKPPPQREATGSQGEEGELGAGQTRVRVCVRAGTFGLVPTQEPLHWYPPWESHKHLSGVASLTQQLQHSFNKQHTRTEPSGDFYANLGDCIRTLRDDIPDLFNHDLNCEYIWFAGTVSSRLFSVSGLFRDL